MKKIYLAYGISDRDRKEGSKRVARKIRDLGFEVYAAAENDSINDKSNNPTPLDIYVGDIERIKESEIFVVNLSGGNEDGTISEIGMVSGWNEAIATSGNRDLAPIRIVAYTSNERLIQPQFYRGVMDPKYIGIASGGANHLVLGMIDKWGEFVGREEDMIERLKELV